MKDSAGTAIFSARNPSFSLVWHQNLAQNQWMLASGDFKRASYLTSGSHIPLISKISSAKTVSELITYGNSSSPTLLWLYRSEEQLRQNILYKLWCYSEVIWYFSKLEYGVVRAYQPVVQWVFRVATWVVLTTGPQSSGPSSTPTVM